MRTIISVIAIALLFSSPANATTSEQWLSQAFTQPDHQHASNRKQKLRGQRSAQPKYTNVASGGLASTAMQYLGKTARDLGLPPRLWCADFINMLVGGSNRVAKSFLSRGSSASYGCINCVAVTSRRGGGHVGIVTGYTSDGNPILISGNSSRKVGIATYSKRSVIAYRYVQ